MAMKSVRIADLKDHLYEHLRAVERGAEIEVRDRDRPIARIVPASVPQIELRIRRALKPFASIRNRRYTPARWKISSLDLLREERGAR
jgi:antitoxin (DNA-binding transcriptional repressor) of toxin-antitoxin stability system